jgi:outer membrane immunogenic protein
MIRKFALTVAALSLAAFSAPVMAADLILDEEDVPVVDVGSSFDWEGAYVGGLLGYYPTFGEPVVGGQIGYNFLPVENFLVGIEGTGLVYFGGDFELWLHGKAGVAMDNVALYGLAGVGTFNFNVPLYSLGVGIEVAVADQVSLFGEAFVREEWGDFPDVPYVQAGIRFHF